jgi:hypothetical protein
MKNIKFVISAVVGSLSLALSSHAAVQGVGITFTATTYHQSSVTNGNNVVTYTTTSTALNNATILSKAQTTLGVTFPAGSKLGVSIVSFPGVSEGDIVVLNSANQIIWNLSEVETTNGLVEASFFVNDINEKTVNAARSRTTTFNGLAGFDFFFELSQPVVESVKKGKDLAAGDEEGYSFSDMQCTGSYTEAFNGSQLTSGSVTSAGAGEHGYFTFATDTAVFEPADGTMYLALSQLPSDVFFSVLFGND